MVTNEIFDYYHRQDVDVTNKNFKLKKFDAAEADTYRKENIKNIRIGLEARFSSGPKMMRGTPGP
jgi:hypothetical protein